MKTDRRDAEHLVRLLLAGKLHAVRVPGDEEEALRDLVRARDSVRTDLMRCRHRLSKLLLRHGIRFDDGAAWTQRHHDWLGTVTLDWPAAQATLLDARGAIDALAHRREQLEREIVAMLPSSPWVVQVGRLRCLRGVDTLTAVGLCAEIGDFERFARAEQLMSYVGLVPSESTTGQQRRLGAITKTGSGHARRLLVEAAWHYRSRPRIGRLTVEERRDQAGERRRSPTGPREAGGDAVFPCFPHAIEVCELISEAIEGVDAIGQASEPGLDWRSTCRSTLRVRLGAAAAPLRARWLSAHLTSIVGSLIRLSFLGLDQRAGKL